ncbi:hypothetical protein OIU84_005548 [Salix udensis]|uniref:Uncharacterized protein n=1 Tax=Salix udensis TaxID=889485 RepID=A0AAD6JWN6_9ROSI|nr:hypothetical protein OIU84_005548 [Salix udensis]
MSLFSLCLHHCDHQHLLRYSLAHPHHWPSFSSHLLYCNQPWTSFDQSCAWPPL